MKITESQLRRLIRNMLQEDNIPGNAPPEKQLHVFDFDDTLGVTQDANGVMLYTDGTPAWKSADDAKKWATENDIDKEDWLKGPGGQTFEKPDGVDGFAVYLSSGALPLVKTVVNNKLMFAPNKPSEKDKGDIAVFDFSPSASAKNAKPIKASLNKVKKLDDKGAKTAIVTARSAENVAKDSTDFSGKKHPVTVQKDLKNFTDKQGASMNTGVYGTQGSNKGEFIKNELMPKTDPEEIHFYDDDPANIDKVANALGGKVDAEVYLYGPGKFQTAPENSKNPKKAFLPKDEKKEDTKEKKESRIQNGDAILERWCKLAGILTD